MKLVLAVVFALAVTVTAVEAQCQYDDVALQRQVQEYNKSALRCESAAREEQDYPMRLWHWKACMWMRQDLAIRCSAQLSSASMSPVFRSFSAAAVCQRRYWHLPELEERRAVGKWARS